MTEEEAIIEQLMHNAADGCRNSQYKLAMIYIEDSKGDEFIPFKAKKLLRKAASRGHVAAKEELEKVKDQKYPWW